MNKRFVIIVLDGFGIGAMEDTKANTLGSILKDFPDLKLPVLERLGLMNAYGKESEAMSFSPIANYGACKLMHFGADTFMGHQEIMGTLPKEPQAHPFQEKVDEVKIHLENLGHKVEVKERSGLKYLVADEFAAIGDNLEADLGMCYNVTAPLDYLSFEKELLIARAVREVATVGRVIVFGGTGNRMEDLWNAEEIKEGKYIGIASAKSKSYEHGYQCLHLGYGVDQRVQAPTILTAAGYQVSLFGKVADIVANDGGKSVSCVSTEDVLELTIREIETMESGFICTNVQETDLAGHSQSAETFKEILETADKKLGEIIGLLKKEDILVVMADHGNDPDIGHSKHTREYVPLLVYKEGVCGACLGVRESLSDVGAAVCDYFEVGRPENGTSFLGMI